MDSNNHLLCPCSVLLNNFILVNMSLLIKTNQKVEFNDSVAFWF